MEQLIEESIPLEIIHRIELSDTQYWTIKHSNVILKLRNLSITKTPLYYLLDKFLKISDIFSDDSNDREKQVVLQYSTKKTQKTLTKGCIRL